MSTITLFALAFSLGAMHALDADHILAVSTLASHKNSWRQTLVTPCTGPLGHGLTMLGVGSLVLLLGMAIPSRLSYVAEWVVGGVNEKANCGVTPQLAFCQCARFIRGSRMP